MLLLGPECWSDVVLGLAVGLGAVLMVLCGGLALAEWVFKRRDF